MTYGRRDSSGEVVLFDAFTMSNALSHGPVIEIDVYDWQKIFWDKISKHRGEPPMPVMVGKTPCWRGVHPPHGIEARTDQSFVAGFDLKIYRVDHNKVRVPNDAEYNKYFKEAVERGTYYLKKMEGSCIKLARRHVTRIVK